MKIIVTGLLESATCDLSGRQGECLEITSEDGSFRGQAILSAQEFLKQLRFISKQENKANGQLPKSKPPAPPSIN